MEGILLPKAAQEVEDAAGLIDEHRTAIRPPAATAKPRPGPRLPVIEVENRLREVWAASAGLLLVAPPGTGKSTEVPKMGLANPGRVICLEPRRVAVRSLAGYVASALGEAVGETVGYRMRLERAGSARTRLEYVTYGVFWREILEKRRVPEDVGLLLLDEFHERSIEMDLVCGWLAQAVRQGEPVPRFGLLSATIDPAVVRRVWPDLPVVEVAAPAFPVELRHLPRDSRFDPRRVVERVAAGVREMMRSLPEGDVLAFVPGYREIRQVIAAVQTAPEARGWELLPLSGEQSGEEQARAIRGGEKRRVIVATNLAETSVTVEGLRGVVDGGLCRRMEYDPARGVNALRTARISRFSARQRSGRAGRQGAGCCLRLWSPEEEAGLEEQSPPEIAQLDLSETWLGLRAMGVSSPEAFPWLDPPPPERWAVARAWLEQLGAISPDGGLTPWGEQLARLPLHPRLGACFLRTVTWGKGAAGARLVGLLQEEGILRRDSRSREVFWRQDDRADFQAELRAWQFWQERGPEAAREAGISLLGARAVRQNAERLQRVVGPALEKTEVSPDGEEEEALLRRALLAGFGDRVGKVETRGMGSARLWDGQPVRFSREGMVRPEEWFLALHLREVVIDGQRVVLAENVVALETRWVEQDLAAGLREVSSVGYDADSGVVTALRERCYGVLTVAVTRQEVSDPAARAAALAKMVAAGEVSLNGWNEEVESLLARYDLLVKHFPELELDPFDDVSRQLVVEEVAAGTRSLRELKRAAVLPVLRKFLGGEIMGLLDHYFPETFALPGRKKPARVNYQTEGGPRISSKLQDFYDLKEHPGVGAGRVPVVVELLAPNQRPVQVTTDLPAFWKGSYPAVKKELKGRYPRHEWR
jgi:ATP-dependent helicase HrpB